MLKEDAGFGLFPVSLAHVYLWECFILSYVVSISTPCLVKGNEAIHLRGDALRKGYLEGTGGIKMQER